MSETAAPMTDLVTVEARPATLSLNFEEARTQLADWLEQYNVVVTADTLAESKRMATDLNKIAKAIDDRRKAEIKKAMAQVEPFDNQMKELFGMAKDCRELIQRQVKSYENETLKRAEGLLADLRAELYVEHNVDDRYRSAEFDDLIKLSSLTPKGALTGKARDTLTQRVKDDRARQDQITNRRMRAENEALRVGIEPLSEEQLNAFINATDDVFESKLAEAIAVEADRQARAQARAEANAQRVNEAREAEATKRSASAPQTGANEKPAPEAKPDPVEAVQPAADERMRRVVATFDVEVDPSISDERVINRLRQMMLDAGITTLSSVQVVR